MLAANACVPLSDLDDYAQGSAASTPLLPAEPSDAGTPPPPVTPEIDIGPLQPVPDAAVLASDAGAVADAAPDAAASCSGEGEFIGAAGECYRFVASLVVHAAASAECERWGGALVAIESPEEDELIASRTNVDVWIGATDAAQEGVMRWPDGTLVGYTNWAAAQPDDFMGEDCVEKRATGAWNDLECNGPSRAFLCER